MTARAAREAAFAAAAAAPEQTRVILAALSWWRHAVITDYETRRQARAAYRLTLAIDALGCAETDHGLTPAQTRVLLAALAWRRAAAAGESERPELARAARRLMRAAQALEGAR